MTDNDESKTNLDYFEMLSHKMPDVEAVVYSYLDDKLISKIFSEIVKILRRTTSCDVSLEEAELDELSETEIKNLQVKLHKLNTQINLPSIRNFIHYYCTNYYITPHNALSLLAYKKTPANPKKLFIPTPRTELQRTRQALIFQEPAMQKILSNITHLEFDENFNISLKKHTKKLQLDLAKNP